MREDLEKLWPLSESFEYAAEVGLALRMQHSGWWEEFEEATPLDMYPLSQAQGMLFLRFLEREMGQDDLLMDALTRFLGNAPGIVRAEIRAAQVDVAREKATSFQAPGVITQGAEVKIVEDEACRAYPDGFHDAWLQRAFDGAHRYKRAGRNVDAWWVRAVHDPSYLQGLMKLAANGGAYLTPTTPVTSQTALAAMRSLGVVCSAVDWALEEKTQVIAQARPLSSHAGKQQGMRGCVINSLAVGASYARRQGQRARVSVVNLGSHHHNGTEEIFLEEPRVSTSSIHQALPFSPSTGEAGQRGQGRGGGANMNLPLPPGAGDSDFIQAVDQVKNQILSFNPGLLLVSLSCDQHLADPSSDLQVSDEGYFQAGERMRSLNIPTVYEIGVATSERALNGGLRAFFALS